MPRGPRSDAPDVLHHMMARGIEGRWIFRDAPDYEDFLTRLAGLVQAGALTVYAWVLLPNHLHLLVRTGARPLARSMRSLLTGYAGAFNCRRVAFATTSTSLAIVPGTATPFVVHPGPGEPDTKRTTRTEPVSVLGSDRGA